jgi:hypothetical protein
MFSNYSIFEAVWTGNTEIVSMLIDHGADVNATFRSYTSPALLFSAVERGDLDMARLLIDRGAEVDSRVQEERSGNTLLHAAVWRTSRGEVLTDDPGDRSKRLPLPEDSSQRQWPVALVLLILDLGADIHAENAKGISPYDLVCNDGYSFRRDEQCDKIRELLCRRHRESLPLRKDDQGLTYLEGWGAPVNGLVARVVPGDAHQLGDEKLTVHWEIMNIGEEDFGISRYPKWTVDVTDEGGNELRRTEMFQQWGHTFGRSYYPQKDVETFPLYPGQTRRREVDLRRFYHFDRPGTSAVAVRILTRYWTDARLFHETGPFPLVVSE